MRLFLDSAKIDEIKKVYELGICDGVTTNPTLIKAALEDEREKIDIENYISSICQVVGIGGSVSLEVISIEADKMVKEARKLFNRFNHIANNVVIKIPINTFIEGENNNKFQGVKAIKKLSMIGIPVNATLVMSPEQAFLAAKAGAKFVSPFMTRIDNYIRGKLNINYQDNDMYSSEIAKKIIFKKVDNIFRKELDNKNIDELYNNNYIQDLLNNISDYGVYDGVDLIKKIVGIFNIYNFKSEVLASSIRSKVQVREVLSIGVDAITAPYNVLMSMTTHPQTEKGLKVFCNNIVSEYEKLF